MELVFSGGAVKKLIVAIAALATLAFTDIPVVERLLVDDVESTVVAGTAGAPPALTLTRWNEVGLTISYISPFKGELVEDEGGIVWASKPEEAHLYPVTDVLNDAPGYEYGVLLRQAPPSNVLSFQWTVTELDSFPQPLLANVEADGSSWEVNEWGGTRRSPAGVGGSMAFYAGGKAFHLLRPWARDANGFRVWGELAVVGNTLTITFPQRFLTDARYPVWVDPTFGYTTTGGSSDDTGGTSTQVWGKAFTTPASNGTLDSITYHGSGSGGAHFDTAIYSNNAGSPGNRLAFLAPGTGTAIAGSNTYTSNITYASLTASTQYWLGLRTDLGNLVWDYDAGTNEAAFNSTGAWDAAAGSTTLIGERITISGTYTAGGAGGGNTSSMMLFGVGKK